MDEVEALCKFQKGLIKTEEGESEKIEWGGFRKICRGIRQIGSVGFVVHPRSKLLNDRILKQPNPINVFFS